MFIFLLISFHWICFLIYCFLGVQYEGIRDRSGFQLCESHAFCLIYNYLTLNSLLWGFIEYIKFLNFGCNTSFPCRLLLQICTNKQRIFVVIVLRLRPVHPILRFYRFLMSDFGNQRWLWALASNFSFFSCLFISLTGHQLLAQCKFRLTYNCNSEFFVGFCLVPSLNTVDRT